MIKHLTPMVGNPHNSAIHMYSVAPVQVLVAPITLNRQWKKEGDKMMNKKRKSEN